jgi:hypothetical protein
MPRTKKRKPIRVANAGISLRLFQRGAQWWCDYRPAVGVRRRVPLHTTQRSVAEELAHKLCGETAERRLTGVTSKTLTIGQLFAWYRTIVTSLFNKKNQPVGEPFRKAAETRMQLFVAAWGRDLPVLKIDQFRVNEYAAARLTGTLSPLAAPDAEKGRKARPVRARTVDADLEWLKSVCNHARKKRREDGKRLLPDNPLSDLSWPKEINVRRPRASAERYEATQLHTDTVDPQGRLRCALALARHTGHRESAILGLRVSDVLLTRERIAAALVSVDRGEGDAEHMPHGAILWRAANDKQGRAHVSPLKRAVRAELDAYLRRADRIGDALLFPAPGRPNKKGATSSEEPKVEQPLGRRLATRWLLRAETLAGLAKLEGGAWHPYRRAWATDRKGESDKDVAAAGGWNGVRAMHQCYQQADAATMLRVVEAG